MKFKECKFILKWLLRRQQTISRRLNKLTVLILRLLKLTCSDNNSWQQQKTRPRVNYKIRVTVNKKKWNLITKNSRVRLRDARLEMSFVQWLSLCLCRQGWVTSQSLRAVPLGLLWNKNTRSRCTSRHLLSLDYHCYMASHWFVVILSTCSVLKFVNTWLLTQLPIWKDATQGSRLLSIICLRYWDKKILSFC